MDEVPILKLASEKTLANAVFENLYALFRAMTRLPGSELVEGESLCYHHTFPTNPMFKGVWRTRIDPDQVDTVIEETIAWFKDRHAPFLFWWTGPDTSPADLPSRLQAHGLMDMAEQQKELAPGIIQTELGAPCMVAVLSQMNRSVLTRVPSGFSIRPVASEEELDSFKRVFLESYEIPEWAGQAWVDATLQLGIGKTPWQMYVGYLHGQPVATNMLFNGGGVASVYAVATVPSARGLGIGAAITIEPLLQAQELGYHYGVLFSTEMGFRVYERIGFRDTGVRINRYLWRDT
jgi:ribosomal protein S18 acetylase RimI-like enzyme